MLRRLHDELAATGIGFRIVGAHAEFRDRLRFERLGEWVGPINRHASLVEAVDVPLVEPPRRDERTNPG